MARVPILTRLPGELLAKLEARCDELGMVRNTAIQRALEAWLEAETGDDLDATVNAPAAPRMPKATPTPNPVDTPRSKAKPAQAQRMTMDDVRPAFIPRLKQK